MGIAITHEQRELAAAVRGTLTRAVPPHEIRKLLDADAPGEIRARPAHWDALAAQGLLGLHLPEESGGGGGDLLDLAVVLEEAGRAALPGPHLACSLASAVLRAAGAHALLPGLADGTRIGAAALGAGTLTAVEAEGGHLLDGAAPPVLSGADADLLLLAASTARGTLWFAVDAQDLSVRAHRGTDPTRATAQVEADGVLVPASRLLDIDTAHVRDLAAVLFAADACGTAAWALQTATEYATVREQFGRPIGQFQGVKHLCADMLLRVEQARALAWDAARASEESPEVRGLTAALAAATALDAAYGCAKDCIQILGGIGFTWEHDAHLHLRRATVARQLLGAGDSHRLRAVRLAEGGARRELRLDLPPEADAHRRAARDVVASARGLDPAAARRALAPTGYAAPHLPPPYGLGAGPVQQLAVQEEMKAAGVRLSDLSIATWVVPSLIAYGSQEQRDRYLLPTLRGELQWCQLFSEPGAGSDLASLRTKAERTADGRWRINGQKVWTSAARTADHGILLARTNPDAPKHKGLTYFIVDMSAQGPGSGGGIEVRPLKEITGDSLFNEVYFDDLLLPADAVVGEVDDGWRVARNTLGNERVHMADQISFSSGLEALIARSAERVPDQAMFAPSRRPAPTLAAPAESPSTSSTRASGRHAESMHRTPLLDGRTSPDPALDGALRARIGALAAEAHALACIGLRTTIQQVSGLEPGAGASLRKLVQTPHQQKIAELSLELLGPEGAVREGAGERAVHGFLMSRCLTIAGGTTQVQLNVVAERILGLPRDAA